MPAQPALPLATKAEHAAAREEWEAFFTSIVPHERSKTEWADWLNLRYENYVSTDDSVTVLSKKRVDAPVGFSLDLCLPAAGALRVYSYWRAFGEGMLEVPIRHFAISCETDPSSISEAKRILRDWILSHEKRG